MARADTAAPRILLMVTGGIAAYKSCFLARLLQQAGFCVRAAMTPAATRFVGPVTLQALTGQPVATDLWGEGQSEPLDHIEYARWADIAVVAPATADILAKAACGIADDIVSTLLVAFEGKLVLAPAMNDAMWRHPATQANCATLRDRGAVQVGPGEGWLACGTTAPGRMSEPEEILQTVREVAASLPPRRVETPCEPDFWHGRSVVITAGPTHEPIDPVRYVANQSTGHMGYALAGEAARRGAKVTLISGPVELPAPRGLSGFRAVTTAAEMAEAVTAALEEDPQWLIMAAAVSDFAPQSRAEGKLKKEDLGTGWSLQMTRSPDILGEVVPKVAPEHLKVVGFALETSEVEERAQAKLRAKNMDYIVANNPTASGSGFGPVDHEILLLGEQGLLWRSESMPKARLAASLLDRLAARETGGSAK
ncbi:bifunctional phosphopantothenoylcysteine decarboxylase/phosphopantothenate--cysteine ligase CoaBC [bacterium CG17_big_fil_post_rev_8_21_14_2_50_64_8]|nr:MAG: bifunctional phosphopantothenoylcysteine decarboxylase/phosphopantothenate--cysteine ligase CoaBC [bacterium CG17_big_fil_post_rev_8_21_14_2_50_64_8]PJA73550.1 MAG: bifunctional phosphopantothenoylcysteine decarboxylase/phosphopantothenate--cysteine ligase CoaBC [bacterium CG_4_9_14_3_um_filter_65_15]